MARIATRAILLKSIIVDVDEYGGVWKGMMDEVVRLGKKELNKGIAVFIRKTNLVSWGCRAPRDAAHMVPFPTLSPSANRSTLLRSTTQLVFGPSAGRKICQRNALRPSRRQKRRFSLGNATRRGKIPYIPVIEVGSRKENARHLSTHSGPQRWKPEPPRQRCRLA